MALTVIPLMPITEMISFISSEGQGEPAMMPTVQQQTKEQRVQQPVR